MAGALLQAGLAFADTAALRVAQGVLDTVLAWAYLPRQGAKHLTAGVGVPLLLQDQVELADACLAAARVTADSRYRRIAEDLVAVVEREFADPTGGYFDAAGADTVTPGPGERTKQVLDDGLPGANAAAARLLLELGQATHEPRYRQRAEATLEAFAGLIPAAGLRGATYLRAARAVLWPR